MDINKFFNYNNFFFKKVSVKGKKKTLYKTKKQLRELQKHYFRRKKFKDVTVYKLLFKFTRNNIFITVTDPLYGYVYYCTGGFEDNYAYIMRRPVAVVNILLGESLVLELRSKFINIVDIEFQGLVFKSHREYLIKGLTTNGLIIRNMVDKTPIAHNGCDRKKKRRK